MGDPGRIPRVTPDDALDALTAGPDRAEPNTAPEIADALDCSRRTALNKLSTLADRGEVRAKKVGGRAKVWWVPLTTDGDDTAAAPPDADTGGDRTESKAQPPSSEVARHPPADGELRERVEAALAAGEYAVTETRVDAALAVVGLIRSDGRVSSKRATRIAEEHGVSLGTVGQWWSETARELSVVETERGSNSYEWAGGES